MKVETHYDAVVVGAGFYGCQVAAYLKAKRGFDKVVVLEREAHPFARASRQNQARVHNGYHYPRSFTTAFRSRLNLPVFERHWPTAVRKDFRKIYAIAAGQSKVSARQFWRFCEEIGAEIARAPAEIHQLFDASRIEDVYQVREYAFDANELMRLSLAELDSREIAVRCGIQVQCVERIDSGYRVVGKSAGETHAWQASYVFNCTYSGLTQIQGLKIATGLKHELTEMALIDPPSVLKGLGITVMDGAYFSMMPYPPRDAYTLSHVRYTPHFAWQDDPQHNPYSELGRHLESRFEHMVRDASRYLPVLRQARYLDSLYEIKTILRKNEGDDGRPILLERNQGMPGCYSILGGKIDNVFDVLEKLDAESLTLAASS